MIESILKSSSPFYGRNIGTILIELSSYLEDGSGFNEIANKLLNDNLNELNSLVNSLAMGHTMEASQRYLEETKRILVQISTIERKIRENYEIISSWKSKHLAMTNLCISNILR